MVGQKKHSEDVTLGSSNKSEGELEDYKEVQLGQRLCVTFELLQQ